MKSGTINCKCGQVFYFESASELLPPTIKCPKCEEIHDISTYPDDEKENKPEIGEENGTDI